MDLLLHPPWSHLVQAQLFQNTALFSLADRQTVQHVNSTTKPQQKHQQLVGLNPFEKY